MLFERGVPRSRSREHLIYPATAADTRSSCPLYRLPHCITGHYGRATNASEAVTMQYLSTDLSPRERYKILTSFVLPRPIAWAPKIETEMAIDSAGNCT